MSWPVRWVFKRNRLRIIALVLFALGLGLGIEGLILTQEDSERPAVQATFNKATRVFKGSATGQDLPASERLAIVVSPVRLVQTKKGKKTRTASLEVTPKALYYAIIGPDGDGKATVQFAVYVPAKLRYIGVRAWTGSKPPKCRLVEVSPTRAPTAPTGGATVASVNERYEPGCLALQLPTQATKKKPKGEKRPTRKTGDDPS